MDELVSIIVPVYNVEKYIEKCLDSIISQTYKNIEIITIIDGSLDNSEKIVENYKRRDERIKIFSRENKGPSYSRMEGIQKATGKYLMFVDSDDWIDIDMVEKMMLEQKKFKADIVKCCHVREFVEQNRKELVIKPFKEIREIKKEEFKEEIYPIFIKSYELNNLWGQLIRKEVIKVENIDTSIRIMAEDLVLNMELFSNIQNIVFLPSAFYHYRSNLNSTTKSIKKDNIIMINNDIKKAYSKMYKYLRIWNMNDEKDMQTVSLRILKEIAVHMKKFFLVEGISDEELVSIITTFVNSDEINTVRNNISIEQVQEKDSKNLYNKNIKRIIKSGKKFKKEVYLKEFIKKIIYR